MPTKKRSRRTKHTELPDKYEPGFVAKLDRRTGIAKVLRQNFEAVANDLGGHEELSHVKAALVERFVFLEATLNKIEADIATDPKGTDELIGKWIQAVNSLSGLAKTLGVERRQSAEYWAEHGPNVEEVSNEDANSDAEDESCLPA